MSLDITLYIDVDIGKKKRIELFETNITHNLSEMAEEAGIYLHLWKPEVLGIREARNLITPLTEGLRKLKEFPDHFKKFDIPNDWGTYKHFVPFVERYLEACKEYPKALIEVDR